MKETKQPAGRWLAAGATAVAGKPGQARGISAPPLRPLPGNFGVLMVVLDHAPSPRSAAAVARLAPAWRGREVVFVAAAAKQAGAALSALLPGLFYNAGKPLGLATLWRLLPWRVVVTVRDGRVGCWTPPRACGPVKG
jgi:hypothetical protein